MQKPQQFGSASSYAKKYSLGNLFLIDDTQDSDATNTHNKTEVELPWLNANTPQFNKVKKALSEGTATIADVRTKFKVSTKVEGLLK